MTDMRELIADMPKSELHMHLEGSIEADLMFALARRNGIRLAYPSEAALREAYRFTNLQSFLDIYYAGLTVLLTEADFHDMTWAYLTRVHAENVRHVEVFISPQAHVRRNVPFAVMMDGIERALERARRELGMTALLILGFQRQYPEEDAFDIVRRSLPWRDRVVGFGLGGHKLGNPPEKFARVFAHCRALGFRTVAHAGEEGPPAFVADSLDLLKVDRVDHGVRAVEDPALVRRLAERGTPLTVCPLSNLKLHVFEDLRQHSFKRLLEAGVCVTMNSDDPSYFGGYMNENYIATAEALDLAPAQIYRVARNGFTAAFLPAAQKQAYLDELDAYWREKAGALPD